MFVLCFSSVSLLLFLSFFYVSPLFLAFSLMFLLCFSLDGGWTLHQWEYDDSAEHVSL